MINDQQQQHNYHNHEKSRMVWYVIVYYTVYVGAAYSTQMSTTRLSGNGHWRQGQTRHMSEEKQPFTTY